MTEYLTTLAGPPPQGEAATAILRQGRADDRTAASTSSRAIAGFIRDAYVKHLREKSKEVVSPYDVAISVPDPFPETRRSASRRSGAERLHPRARRAVRRLCPQRARLRDPDDLRAAGGRHNRNWDWHGESQGRASVTNDIREMLALNPGFKHAGRARQRRSRDALRRQQICDRPPAAARQRRTACSSRSIAAGTCFISTRRREKHSPTRRERSTALCLIRAV